MRFHDRKGREFEVTEHWFGEHTLYSIECYNGWALHFESQNASLTKVGFRQIIDRKISGDLIIRTPEEIKEWLDSRQLIQLPHYGSI